MGGGGRPPPLDRGGESGIPQKIFRRFELEKVTNLAYVLTSFSKKNCVNAILGHFQDPNQDFCAREGGPDPPPPPPRSLNTAHSPLRYTHALHQRKNYISAPSLPPAIRRVAIANSPMVSSWLRMVGWATRAKLQGRKKAWSLFSQISSLHTVPVAIP